MAVAATAVVQTVVHAAAPGETTGSSDRDPLCPAGFVLPSPVAHNRKDAPIEISADQAQINNPNLTTFSGEVKIQQADKQLQADLIHYDRGAQLFDAIGHVLYSNSGWYIEGDTAHLNLNTNSGVINTTHYSSRASGQRGEAQQITILEKNKLRMKDASFTSCPPGSNAWWLSAATITLDKNTHQGSAESVVLHVAGAPVLYLPYMRFPIGDERLTGLLYPGFATSQRHGTEYYLPFYWNIDPQYDMTLNPHFMSKRGWMLESEFRYLGEKSAGHFNLDVLPNDQTYGDKRQRVEWEHNGDLDAGWSTQVTYVEVSDTQYINDFTNSITTSSITHLDRRGTLAYNAPTFEFTLLAQDYQTISGAEPYKRLPQINLNSRRADKENTLNYNINSEIVRFDHLDPAMVIGSRLRLNPYISYPFSTDSGYFTPRISLYQVNYALKHLDPTLQPNIPSKTPSITVPVYSIDTGLYFERETQWGNIPLLHTLEPRLYYLYAPYKDQSTLPVFDTGLTTFNELTMFSENRFSGGDRVGDANQLAAAVSSRLYNANSGYELFAATVGELFYFKNRLVTLPGQNIDNLTQSSLFGTMALSPINTWRLRGDLQWNPHGGHIEVGNTRLQYLPGNDNIVNFDYRYRRELSGGGVCTDVVLINGVCNDAVRTYAASTIWRLNPQWRLFAAHQFDIENNHKLQNIFGIQYDSCCWALRLVGYEHFNTLTSTISNPLYDRAVYFSIELKGLSNFGRKGDIDTILRDGIYGYTN
ncbi:MAG: LPS-assembly protein LptD [Gammaproteobacteria bacterium]|nr:LPS-assembly protein LptD [Gammaproteobacteria bacterium]